MRIVFYYAYHIIAYPPIVFQDDTLYFGWILEVVTFQLPLVFNLGLSYL